MLKLLQIEMKKKIALALILYLNEHIQMQLAFLNINTKRSIYF